MTTGKVYASVSFRCGCGATEAIVIPANEERACGGCGMVYYFSADNRGAKQYARIYWQKENKGEEEENHD